MSKYCTHLDRIRERKTIVYNSNQTILVTGAPDIKVAQWLIIFTRT